MPAKPIVPEFYTNKLGEVKRRTGKVSANWGRVTKQIFSNRCERVLGAMLMTPLGQNFYDDDVPEDFVVDFNNSLFQKIEFAPDDTPDERREKELVIAAKEELKRRMDRGEDIVEIVRQEKKMLKEKFESYVEFEQGLNKLRAGNASPEEISEYALAAKKIMDQHDIEMPLSLGEDESEAYKELQRLIGEKPEEQGDEETGELQQ